MKTTPLQNTAGYGTLPVQNSSRTYDFKILPDSATREGRRHTTHLSNEGADWPCRSGGIFIPQMQHTSQSHTKPDGIWFGSWCVKSNGDIIHYDRDRSGQFYESYDIPCRRLNEDWYEHMTRKRWVDPDEFEDALDLARRLYNETITRRR